VLRASLLSCLLLLCATHADAGGYSITTIGPRRATTLTILAHPDDLSAIVHNPAGLVNQPGVRASAFGSLYFVSTDFRLQALDPALYPEISAAAWPVDAQGYYTNTVKPESYFGAVPFLAVATDLGFMKAKDVSAGVALHVPGFYGASLPKNAPTAYQVINGNFLVASATLAVGWRIHPRVSVGVNVSYNLMRIQATRRLSLVASLSPPGGPASPLGTLAQQAIGDLVMDFNGFDNGVGWTASVLFQPHDRVSIGLAYNGATSARFVGPLTLRARSQDDLKSALTALGYKLPKSLSLDQPYPHMLGLGVAVTVTSFLELAFEGRIWFYNVFGAQRIAPIYDPNEPGQEPFDASLLSMDKHYQPSFELSIGSSWQVHPRVSIGFGVGYDQSPIPNATFSLDFPSMSYVQIACGVTGDLGAGFRGTLGYLQYAYIPRVITNSQAVPPLNGRLAGWAHLPIVALEKTF
jgi:long-chain fatty acid transport protein